MINDGSTHPRPSYRLTLVLLVAAILVALPIRSAVAAVDDWACAGAATSTSTVGAGKVAGSFPTSPLAIVLFAHFADESMPDVPPSWSGDLLNPARTGSVAHFYDTMSFGRHNLRGDVAPRRYASREAAGRYGPDEVNERGQYGRFALEILQVADGDIDFSRYDNDGPDGEPNSGDDDGIVDVVFINLAKAPAGFVFRDATGIADLGFEQPFTTDDLGAAGTPILIDPASGTLQAVTDFDAAAGVMAHEYGHLLGLRDLYDVEWTDDPSTPEKDSAGIGRWGLMGWGATGWPGARGPSSLSAWSRLRLGWANQQIVSASQDSIVLPAVDRGGDVVQIPLNGNEFYLVENRRQDAYYNRGIPAEGLLVWHVSRPLIEGELAFWWDVDLECADGLWTDAGFPAGRQVDAVNGGDNLDFWAHDEGYARAHAGNLGDATDPFDGVRARRFALDTNPSASTNEGADVIAIDEITFTGGSASFLIRTNPPRLEIRHVAPRAPKVTAGTAVAITFQVANVGGTRAPDLRAELRAHDAAIELVTPGIELFPLAVGASSAGRGVGPDGFPMVRFPKGLVRETTTHVDLIVLAGATEVARETVQITGIPSNELEVSVVDEDGAPVEGILVDLPGTDVKDDLFFDARLVTDEAGVARFYLPEGLYEAVAVPEGDSEYGRVSARLSVDSDTGVELTLPRTILLTGVVQDQNGDSPIRDVYVWAFDRSSGNGSAGALTARDGSFEIKLIPGVYEISSRALGSGSLTTEHGDFALDEDTHLILELANGVEFVVDVRDPNGDPVDDVQIDLRIPDGDYVAASTTRLSRGGRFEVRPGTYDVNVSRTPPPWVGPPEPVRVTIASDTTVIVPLTRGQVLKGRFVDADGNLRPNRMPNYTSVSLLDTEGRDYRARLDLQWLEFEVAVDPGQYRLDLSVYTGPGAEDPGFPSHTFGPIEIHADTVMDFVVSNGVLLEGQVLGYSAPSQPGSFGGQVYISGSNLNHYGFLDTEGRFSLRIIPGEYQMNAFFGSEGQPPSQSLGTILVEADTSVAFRLVDDETVEGRLVDHTGSPIGGLSISASTVGGSVSYSNNASTQLDGGFRMRLPPGDYAVYASQSLPNAFLRWSLGDMSVPGLGVPTYSLPGGAIIETRIEDTSRRQSRATVNIRASRFRLTEWLGSVLPIVTGFMEVGSSMIPVNPGRYSAVVSPGNVVQDHVHHRVIPELVVNATEILRADLAFPAMDLALSGTITLAPADSDASVYLYAYNEEEQLMAEARQIPDGSYHLPLSAGEYEIAVYVRLPSNPRIAHHIPSLTVTEDRVLNIDLTSQTAIGEDSQTPSRFELAQSYPNPFNAETIIRFSLDAPGEARLEIFDLLGQQIRVLAEGQMPGGASAARWDGTDAEGRLVASGVYLYRLIAGDRIATRKLLLLR